MVAAVTGEDLADGGGVADVDGVVGVAGLAVEPIDLPARAGLRAEEGAAHVVVDAGDVQAVLEEQSCRFGTDKAARTRYDHYGHRP